jgi:hypothetical protein
MCKTDVTPQAASDADMCVPATPSSFMMTVEHWYSCFDQDYTRLAGLLTLCRNGEFRGAYEPRKSYGLCGPQGL